MRAASEASQAPTSPTTRARAVSSATGARPERLVQQQQQAQQARDPAGTAALHRRLAAFARRYVGDRDEAEDVAQEALFRAARGWGRLRSAERAEAWVFRICRHAAIDHVRARRVRQAVWASLPRDAHEWAGAQPSTEAPDTTGAEHDPQAFAGALERLGGRLRERPGGRGRLPAHHRLLLTLHYGRGYSQALLCRMTGLNASALRVRLFRARGLLALQRRRESHPARARRGS